MSGWSPPLVGPTQKFDARLKSIDAAHHTDKRALKDMVAKQHELHQEMVTDVRQNVSTLRADISGLGQVIASSGGRGGGGGGAAAGASGSGSASELAHLRETVQVLRRRNLELEGKLRERNKRSSLRVGTGASSLTSSLLEVGGGGGGGSGIVGGGGSGAGHLKTMSLGGAGLKTISTKGGRRTSKVVRGAGGGVGGGDGPVNRSVTLAHLEEHAGRMNARAPSAATDGGLDEVDEDWEELWDDTSRRYYYHNRRTKQTTWTPMTRSARGSVSSTITGVEPM